MVWSAIGLPEAEITTDVAVRMLEVWTERAAFSILSANGVARLRERRLAHMVLEALQQSDEAIVFYDEKDGVVFSNDAYHRVFPHGSDRAQLLGTGRLDLCHIEIEAGDIDASLAVFEAEKQTSSPYQFFDPDIRQDLADRLALVEDLRNALSAGEFELYYQPQFVAETRRLVGFEALIRWRHPKRGLVSPAVFIPIAEDQGLIETLGEWVLATACAEARHWPKDLKIAVNVSPLQVLSGRFSAILGDTLMRSGLAPHRLELEITESVFMADEARTRAELENWKAFGVRIALDDFGCGYSSLGYLSAFRFDKIKIDRGFLRQFDPQQPDAPAGVILRAVIDLGRALGLTVTAEGVETSEQLDYLNGIGCPEVQGYLLGRAMPAHQARQLFP